jgi:hypothetical protein
MPSLAGRAWSWRSVLKPRSWIEAERAGSVSPVRAVAWADTGEFDAMRAGEYMRDGVCPWACPGPPLVLLCIYFIYFTRGLSCLSRELV